MGHDHAEISVYVPSVKDCRFLCRLFLEFLLQCNAVMFWPSTCGCLKSEIIDYRVKLETWMKIWCISCSHMMIGHIFSFGQIYYYFSKMLPQVKYLKIDQNYYLNIIGKGTMEFLKFVDWLQTKFSPYWVVVVNLNFELWPWSQN